MFLSLLKEFVGLVLALTLMFCFVYVGFEIFQLREWAMLAVTLLALPVCSLVYMEVNHFPVSGRNSVC